jgi:hypothetical protein
MNFYITKFNNVIFAKKKNMIESRLQGNIYHYKKHRGEKILENLIKIRNI